MRTLTALIFVTSFAFAQDCSVDGTVVNSATGAPVARAHITVAGAEESAFADSGAAGKWSLQHITCGPATLSVERVGFLRKDQDGQTAKTLSLVADAPLHDVTLKLTPQAVIAGRVTDDQGDPVQWAQVSVMKSRVSNGLRALQGTISGATDDQGEYRFSGLEAGRYLVCASGQGQFLAVGKPRPSGEKCYPAPLATGSTVNITAGYEARIDFTLPTLSTVQVRGVISGLPEGAHAEVALVRDGHLFPGAVRKDGVFVVQNVVPGSYMLGAETDEKLMARIPVEVGGNGLEGIRLHLEPGVTLTGTIQVVSATGKKLDAPHVGILMNSTTFGNPSVDANGPSFTWADLVPGNYRMEFSVPPPLYLKTARMGDRDLIHSDVTIGPGAGAVEIVLSDDAGAVEGDVSSEDGVTAAWVFLEKDGAPSRNVRADAKGHFKIDTVPPGDYKVYAWDDNTNVEYANPQWMLRNGKGVVVTVAPGQTAQVRVPGQIAPPEN